MLIELESCQLVLVDYQTKLTPALFESQLVLANAQRLTQWANLLGVPAFYTEQNPSKLGATEAPLLQALQEANAKSLAKMQFSAVEEGLVEMLRPAPKAPQGNARSLPKHLQKPAAPQRNAVVLAGVEAHICLLQTALDLLEEEFDVWVVTDACTSRTERNRDAAFDRLAAAGAELVTTEMVGFEWVRTAEHPDFKAMQALIK
ncbi:isochorismatase family protein [Curvibacter sp. CHRR-16]|uniref:isochorismatase family protein n=1 Tax=Curvibacter sp. CHRR-16 TaxID=2835872 RepID=UPI001BD99E7F|nr:isochorismatase family protein [Curvibacter sp. CHRR-16]MBT0571040.1 isochorismatase family protein [Curvibacter sp. CHRR-16]